ncbi:MAG: peptidase U32 family protein [Clostridium sp.]
MARCVFRIRAVPFEQLFYRTVMRILVHVPIRAAEIYNMEENRRVNICRLRKTRGTYIFNSKDLCMIEHIPELVEAGVDSFKIEGRMKTALYVAVVARTYRQVDDYFEDRKNIRKIFRIIRRKLQNVPTVSLRPDFLWKTNA